MVLMRRPLPGAIQLIRTASKAGERKAESPARINIKPIAEGTWPLAIAVISGAKGAPGQTARIRNPTETAGLVWKRKSKPTVIAGTIAKFASRTSRTRRVWRAEASRASSLTFIPIDNMIATRALTLSTVMTVEACMMLPPFNVDDSMAADRHATGRWASSARARIPS